MFWCSCVFQNGNSFSGSFIIFIEKTDQYDSCLEGIISSDGWNYEYVEIVLTNRSVADITGSVVGISGPMKEGIFNGTTKHEDKSKGMGLGLILVKKIIKSYDGKIWVEDKVKSDHSHGSNFVVLLLEVK